MTYKYSIEKQKIFTEEGVKKIIQIKDNAVRLISRSGAATVSNIIQDVGGDSFLLVACIDFLVETGYLKKVASGSMTQHDVYILA